MCSISRERNGSDGLRRPKTHEVPRSKRAFSQQMSLTRQDGSSWTSKSRPRTTGSSESVKSRLLTTKCPPTYITNWLGLFARRRLLTTWFISLRSTKLKSFSATFSKLSARSTLWLVLKLQESRQTNCNSPHKRHLREVLHRALIKWSALLRTGSARLQWAPNPAARWTWLNGSMSVKKP